MHASHGARAFISRFISLPLTYAEYAHIDAMILIPASLSAIAADYALSTLFRLDGC